MSLEEEIKQFTEKHLSTIMDLQLFISNKKQKCDIKTESGAFAYKLLCDAMDKLDSHYAMVYHVMQMNDHTPSVMFELTEKIGECSQDMKTLIAQLSKINC